MLIVFVTAYHDDAVVLYAAAMPAVDSYYGL